MGAKHLKPHTNSQLVVTQIKGDAKAKEPSAIHARVFSRGERKNQTPGNIRSN
jgi:hypothetical protein